MLFFKILPIIKKHNVDIIHVHHSIGITALFWKHILIEPLRFQTYTTHNPINNPINNLDSIILIKKRPIDGRLALISFHQQFHKVFGVW